MPLSAWVGTGLGALAIAVGSRPLAALAIGIIVGAYLGDWLARRT